MFARNQFCRMVGRPIKPFQLLRTRPTLPLQLYSKRFASGGSPLQGLGTVVNALALAYAGGLVVCGGALYFLYSDANSRQRIPYELGIDNTILTVKAIGKDDVLESPRYAVKHYRRLLIELAKKEIPDLEFEENLPDGLRNYVVPLLPATILFDKKSSKFANFYVDIVLRYARALLAKGLLQEPTLLLKRMVDDDEIFNSIGSPERMSQCCRTLSKICEDPEEQLQYLKRSVKLLTDTFRSLDVDSEYLLSADSQLTDELLRSLNAIAFFRARTASNLPKRQKAKSLDQALNIYLANLRVLSSIQQQITTRERTQASFPLINCDLDDLNMGVAEIKAHISEIFWARGHKESAIAWGEEVVHEIYFDNTRVAKASPILAGVLGNLRLMYTKLNRPEDVQRCEALQNDLFFFDKGRSAWYDSLIQRFTKIIYYRGPLGVIEKALKERIGPAQPLPDIEEYEDEDEE